MEVFKHTGVMAEILEAMQDRGDPNQIRRITVTEAEMEEIVQSGVFRKTINTHYGGSDVLVWSNIEADSQGKVISMYLGDTLICIGPWEPSGALATVAYAPLVETPKDETEFSTEVGGKVYMLSGSGNPGDDFVIGKNANIELGIAVRKVNDQTYYGDGANGFDIELEDGESWSFAVTVGSLKAGVPNITEMYDVSLYLDTDGSGAENAIKWDLGFMQTPQGKGINYAWYNTGVRIIDDSATNADFSVTQMIQRYEFPFISNALPANTQRTKQGVPLGAYGIKLVAKPRLTSGTTVEVEVLATITQAEPA